MLCGVQSLCSWSLVELYRALESSVEAHKAVLAAHPMYANLMERALAKVVLQHVTTLEKFCQVHTAHPLDTLLLRHGTSTSKSSVRYLLLLTGHPSPSACLRLGQVLPGMYCPLTGHPFCLGMAHLLEVV